MFVSLLDPVAAGPGPVVPLPGRQALLHTGRTGAQGVLRGTILCSVHHHSEKMSNRSKNIYDFVFIADPRVYGHVAWAVYA